MIGQTVAHYKVAAKLGAGGMGEVYRATGKPESCFVTDSPVFQADLSPDGRWLAYSSTESGKLELYVRSFPDRGGKWQVSSAGGQSPAWSPKGGTLFFTLLDNRAMVANYTARGNSLVLDRPSFWADPSLTLASQGSNRNYSVSSDGQRPVVLADPGAGQKPDTHVVLLENFFDEVARRFAPKAKE